MQRILLSVLLLCSFLVARGQATYEYCYWLDDHSDERHYGISNGEHWSLDLDVFDLSETLHQLHIQVKDTAGRWSSPRCSYFLKLPTIDNLRARYWFDDGEVTETEVVEGIQSIDVSALSQGVHTFHYQMRGMDGTSSSPRSAIFIKMNGLSSLRARYWFDDGEMTETAVANGIQSIDVSALSQGVHFLHYQVASADGMFSPIRTAIFIKNQGQIVRYEYWLNDDVENSRIVAAQPMEPYRLIESLDVESRPIRSSAFHFEVEENVPYIYTKNDFHARFYNSSGPYAEDSATYVDESSKREVTESILLRIGSRTDKTLKSDSIRWYKLEASTDDDLLFRVGQPCSVVLFSPAGDSLLALSGEAVTDTFMYQAPADGVYYLALHSVTGKDEQTTVDYMRRVYTYTDEQGVNYQLNAACNAYSVTGYTDALVEDVVIPDALFSQPIKEIKEKAFDRASTLRSLVVTSSVSEIGDAAFGGCHNLLVVDWKTEIPLSSTYFDAVEKYGNMLVFATKSDGSFGGNVVVDGVAQRIALVDGKSFRNPRKFTAKHISYGREFTKKTKVGVTGGWEGIVLPFDVQTIISEKKGELAPFGVADFSTTLPFWVAEWQRPTKVFVLVGAITANQPFIMEVPNSEDYEEEFNIEGKVTFEAENTIVYATTDMVPVTGNGYSLQGTYEGVDADSYVYALNEAEYVSDDNGETFLPGGVFVANSRSIRPFEAYVHNNQLTRSRYLPVQGGTAQGIDRLLLKTHGDNDAWYTLQGVRLNGMPMQKGMYIHGGKKVMVR